MQPSASPFVASRCLVRHRHLILDLTRRDVVGRYRGSLMGLAWSFFNPVLMLAAYTFVFGAIFKARWPERALGESKIEFALILFAGLIVHSVLADCFQRAPGLIASNVNYVKRVVFPLEVLPIVAVLSAVFHALISSSVLLLAMVLVAGHVPITAVAFPLVLVPYAIGLAGFSWILASLGVFLRDIGQSIGVVVMLLMFLSPVFFPLSAVPAEFKGVVVLNPLTYFIETARGSLLWGVWPNPQAWVGATLKSAAVAMAGLWWFQKTRKGFADVL